MSAGHRLLTPELQKLRVLHRSNPSRKTFVFERSQRNQKVRAKSGLNLSQNPFLISASQKVRVRLSFERVHDDQTEKDCSHGRAGEAATSPAAPKVARARSSDAGEITSKPMLIGYARVSTVDQNLALQRDALTEAGCTKIFTEQMSGAVTDRPALHDALEFARSGDTLIVWKLDRLARSMKQLIETVETPAGEGHRVSQPDRSPRHDDRTRAAGLSHVRRAGGIRAQPDPRAHPSGSCRRSARGPDGRPSAKTHRRRHRGCQGDAGQPRHRRHPNRAPPRRLTGDALSVHPGRANREYLR